MYSSSEESPVKKNPLLTSAQNIPRPGPVTRGQRQTQQDEEADNSFIPAPEPLSDFDFNVEEVREVVLDVEGVQAPLPRVRPSPRRSSSTNSNTPPRRTPPTRVRHMVSDPAQVIAQEHKYASYKPTGKATPPKKLPKPSPARDGQAVYPVTGHATIAGDVIIESGSSISAILKFEPDRTIELRRITKESIDHLPDDSSNEVETVVIVKKDRVYKLNCFFIPQGGNYFDWTESDKAIRGLPDIDILLKHVKLILVRPRDVIDKQPGLTHLYVDTWCALDLPFVFYNGRQVNEEWVIRLLTQACCNCYALIAPFSSVNLSSLRGPELRYISLSSELLPGQARGIGLNLPELLVLENMISSNSSNVQLIGDEEPATYDEVNSHDYLLRDELCDHWKRCLSATIFNGKRMDTIKQRQLMLKYPIRSYFVYHYMGTRFAINQKLFKPTESTRVYFIEHLFIFDGVAGDLEDFRLPNLRTIWIDNRKPLSRSEFWGRASRLLKVLSLGERNLRFVSIHVHDDELQAMYPKLIQVLKAYKSSLVALKLHGYTVPRNEGEIANSQNVAFDLHEFEKLHNISLLSCTCIKLNSFRIGNLTKILSLSIPIDENRIIGKLNYLHEFTYVFTDELFNSLPNFNGVSMIVKMITRMKSLRVLKLLGSAPYFTADNILRMADSLIKLKTYTTLIVDELNSAIEKSSLREYTMKTGQYNKLFFLNWQLISTRINMIIEGVYNFINFTENSVILVEENCVKYLQIVPGRVTFNLAQNKREIEHLRISSIRMFEQTASLFDPLYYIKLVTFSKGCWDCGADTNDNETYIQLAERVSQMTTLTRLRGFLSQQFILHLTRIHLARTHRLSVHLSAPQSQLIPELADYITSSLRMPQPHRFVFDEITCPTSDERGALIIDLIKNYITHT